jgi:hypothetical protein
MPAPRTQAPPPTVAAPVIEMIRPEAAPKPRKRRPPPTVTAPVSSDVPSPKPHPALLNPFADQ